MEEIYFDNSATTRVLPEAVEAMNEACEAVYGNPSSLHGKGLQGEKLVDFTREALAGILSCSSHELFFTSGGTESNNWAVLGCVNRRRHKGKHIITTKIEHSSVLKVFQHLESSGYDVSYLEVNSDGVVDIEQLKDLLRKDTVLVSVMYVNNETGVIQPISEIGGFLKEADPDVVFHVDAVQAFGKIPITPVELDIDLMSLSAHKIHGPKGVGVLFVRKGVGIAPLLLGGDQEDKMRAGTENVPGIAGLGAAVGYLPGWLQDTSRIESLKKQLVDSLVRRLPGVMVNGSLDKAVPHIVNLSFPGIKAEVLVHYLEQSGIYISTGSACHSRSGKGSHVLSAMGVRGPRLEGAVRISFSHLNTPGEIEYFADKITEAVTDLQSLI